MKIIKYLAPVAFIASFVISSPTYAATDFSVSDLDVYVGDTFAVSLSVDAVAAWNVHISSDGPVDNCSLVDVDATSDALDAKKEFTAECQATGVGEITISLSGDYTTADGITVDLLDSLIVKADVKPEGEPGSETDPENDSETDLETNPETNSETGETHKEEYNGEDVNTPDTGANHTESGVNAGQSACLIALSIAVALVVLGLIIRHKARRASIH